MSLFVVRIRRNIGKRIRPEAEQLEGKTFKFEFGWVMDDGNDPYPSETAWLPSDPAYPVDGPTWIASGDLIPLPQGGGGGVSTIPPHIAITWQPKSVCKPPGSGPSWGQPSIIPSSDVYKPMTQPLSPASRVVLDAANRAYDQAATVAQGSAAALRAAADNVPAPHHHEEMAFHSGFWAGIEYIRSIAAELEGFNG